MTVGLFALLHHPHSLPWGLLSIRFGARLPAGRLREIVDEFSHRHEAKLALYGELENKMRQTSDDPFAIATIRFGRAFEAAVATWLDDLHVLSPTVFDGPRAETVRPSDDENSRSSTIRPR